MDNILVIGAGRSATTLIDYLLNYACKEDSCVCVADSNLELAESKIQHHPHGRATWLDVTKVQERKALIQRADIVISMLPPQFHIPIAKDCLEFGKHFVSASYVSKEMKKLHDEARVRGLVFMSEIGLDPGIDHMSAMQKIDEIKSKGGKISAFRSYTGGLIAPESDDNPWHYKFTWNPYNVVRAGQGTAQYLEDGKVKYVPYNRLFSNHILADIPGMGEYEVYANRDSIQYLNLYDLQDTPNILRGTIRSKGFCDAWNALIKIGLTDSKNIIQGADKLSYNNWLEGFIGNGIAGASLRKKTARFLGEDESSDVMEKLAWLGLFSKKQIEKLNATPADILLNLLLEKWHLQPEDKDMIIMQHEFEYELENQQHLLTSTMVMKGNDSVDTAMSRLVGLPLGIFVRLLMEKEINLTGVQIPVMKEVYDPVLEELESFGVKFEEHEKVLENA